MCRAPHRGTGPLCGSRNLPRALEKAGELAVGPACDVRTGVGAGPRQGAFAVCVGSWNESDGNASKRVVGDERSRRRLPEVRREKGAKAGPGVQASVEVSSEP